MAILLGLDKSLVLKMRNGKSDIHPPTWARIRAELLKRGPEIEGVLVEMES
jgi:hypothetical protein